MAMSGRGMSIRKRLPPRKLAPADEVAVERPRNALSSREEYQTKAIACVAQAELIRDPQARTTMPTVAKGYLDLSDYIGRLERGTNHGDQRDQHPNNDS